MNLKIRSLLGEVFEDSFLILVIHPQLDHAPSIAIQDPKTLLYHVELIQATHHNASHQAHWTNKSQVAYNSHVRLPAINHAQTPLQSCKNQTTKQSKPQFKKNRNTNTYD